MADYYGGRTMYSSSTDECYDVGKHGGRRMYSNTDECYDGRRPAAYADGCYDGARQTAVYSDEYSRGGYGGEQQYYKREEKEHKNRERLGEVGALAGGAFALVTLRGAPRDEGPRAQAEAHDRGRPGGRGGDGRRGGYAYHEHREQKEAARYESNEHRVPHAGYYYCN